MSINRMEQVQRLEKLFKVYGRLPEELKEVLGNAKALAIAQLAKDPEYEVIVQKLDALREKYCPDCNVPVPEVVEEKQAESTKDQASTPTWEDHVNEFMDWCQRGKALQDFVRQVKEGIESQKILSEEDLKTMFELPGDPADPNVFVAKRAANDLYIFLKSAKAGIKGTRNPYILQKLYELALEREDEIFENAHKAFPTMIKRP